MNERYCRFCTKKLMLPYYAIVIDADGDRVRVHKQCADEARRFWNPGTIEVPLLDGPTVSANNGEAPR